MSIRPEPKGFGEDRGCQPYASAAASTTAIDRARMKTASSSSLARSSFSRKSTGSAPAAAASSSMNDSLAKVVCGPLGSRRLPVRSGVSKASGKRTTSVSWRRFGIAYISAGAAAPPGAGRSGRIPMSCAIRTVSGSLYPTCA